MSIEKENPMTSLGIETATFRVAALCTHPQDSVTVLLYRRHKLSGLKTRLFHAGFLLDLLFDPEDGGDISPDSHGGIARREFFLVTCT
jgi:hypothetical protein